MISAEEEKNGTRESSHTPRAGRAKLGRRKVLQDFRLDAQTEWRCGTYNFSEDDGKGRAEPHRGPR